MFKFNFPKFNFEEDKAESVPEPVIEVEVPEKIKTFDEIIMDTVKEQATSRVYDSLSQEIVCSWYKSKGVDLEELREAIREANRSNSDTPRKYCGFVTYEVQSYSPRYGSYAELSLGDIVRRELKEHAESIVEERYNAK